MEAAATPLRNPHVTALLGRVIIEHLVVDDAVAAELVRARTDAGENPQRVIADAIEIGARVLDREHAGAAVEVLKQDLEHASREVEQRLGQTSETVGAELKTQLEQAFGPDSGHVTRVLERHFGSESTTAVQHHVRAAVADRAGNCRFHAAARNFNPPAAMSGRITIVEAERVVEVGEMHPDDIHLPGIFVKRIVALTPEQGAHKDIEKRTTREREGTR